MAFEGVEKCAVSSCKKSCYGPCNLCREHSVPGAVVCVGDGTGIVASGYVERAGERGLIVIDDLDLGELFGRRGRIHGQAKAPGVSKCSDSAEPGRGRVGSDSDPQSFCLLEWPVAPSVPVGNRPAGQARSELIKRPGKQGALSK
jgi:hypothetical protein